MTIEQKRNPIILQKDIEALHEQNETRKRTASINASFLILIQPHSNISRLMDSTVSQLVSVIRDVDSALASVAHYQRLKLARITQNNLWFVGCNTPKIYNLKNTWLIRLGLETILNQPDQYMPG